MHQSGSAGGREWAIAARFHIGALTNAPLPGMGHPSGAEAENVNSARARDPEPQ
jgi:hypothetical protein